MNYCFTGMQRSGNHAIIDWFAQHFPSFHLYNNMRGVSINSEPTQEELSANCDISKATDIYTWENVNYSQLKLCNGDEHAPIIIIRDPLNWFASWYRFPYPNENMQFMSASQCVVKYIQFTIEASWFPQDVINFNKWAVSSEYRREVEERFLLPFSDNGLNTVHQLCGGSSFDRFDRRNNAQQMKVNERWELVFQDPEYYQPIFDNIEPIEAVMNDIFGLELPEVFK